MVYHCIKMMIEQELCKDNELKLLSFYSFLYLVSVSLLCVNVLSPLFSYKCILLHSVSLILFQLFLVSSYCLYLFQECDVNLQEQGTLLLQDEFTVQKSRSKASKRQVFLFDDLIVFAKQKKMSAGRDEFTYKSSLKV